MQDLAIEASGLTRRFGPLVAVDNLDLKIPRASIYGFLGPNGSGKSTSIRLLTGLLRPDSGSINVLGFTLPAQAEALRLRIGYMTQKFSLYGDLTVEENLRFMAKIYGLHGREEKNRVAELLGLYGLESQKKQLADTMSGGQKQRLGLAAATIHNPELLFLDEPTSAVDPENRREFWEKLFDLSDAGTTILVSSHYMDEAERCHGLAILANGKKRADGSPQTLMDEMGANVVEIGGESLRQLKQQLIELPEVVSAAQQGVRLRVLVDDAVAEPMQWLNKQSVIAQGEYEMRIVRPSLEDVFVTTTGDDVL
jgi:ABC-2 type transport system ATP-binding protein